MENHSKAVCEHFLRSYSCELYWIWIWVRISRLWIRISRLWIWIYRLWIWIYRLCIRIYRLWIWIRSKHQYQCQSQLFRLGICRI